MNKFLIIVVTFTSLLTFAFIYIRAEELYFDDHKIYSLQFKSEHEGYFSDASVISGQIDTHLYFHSYSNDISFDGDLRIIFTDDLDFIFNNENYTVFSDGSYFLQLDYPNDYMSAILYYDIIYYNIFKQPFLVSDYVENIDEYNDLFSLDKLVFKLNIRRYSDGNYNVAVFHDSFFAYKEFNLLDDIRIFNLKRSVISDVPVNFSFNTDAFYSYDENDIFYDPGNESNQIDIIQPILNFVYGILQWFKITFPYTFDAFKTLILGVR